MVEANKMVVVTQREMISVRLRGDSELESVGRFGERARADPLATSTTALLLRHHNHLSTAWASLAYVPYCITNSGGMVTVRKTTMVPILTAC